jgi:hypothetical protein
MDSELVVLTSSFVEIDPKETLTSELQDHDRRRHLAKSRQCDPTRRLFLALRPPKFSRSSTEHITKMTR